MSDPCASCPLKKHWGSEWAPVPNLNPDGASILMLGQAPGKQEMQWGRPFIGKSSMEAVRAIEKVGLNYNSVGWANCVRCRYPYDDMKMFNAKLKKLNKKRVNPYPNPEVQCRYFLSDITSKYSNIVTMGSVATKSILPGSPSMDDVRGGPTYVGDTKVLPTYHPAYVFRNPMYRWIYQEDIARALRWFTDTLKYVSPEVLYHPSPEELHDWIQQYAVPTGRVYYDVETDGIDSLTCNLRCIGFCADKRAVIIPFLTCERDKNKQLVGKSFYSGRDDRDIRKLIRGLMENTNVVKIGHNSGYYDRVIVERAFDCTPRPAEDTILKHRLSFSEYPHRLNFAGSTLLDVPAWKAEHRAVTSRTDMELWEYNATDCDVTECIDGPLSEMVVETQQEAVLEFDTNMQELCYGMHQMGMLVDQKRRREHEVEQETKRAQHLKAFLDMVGKDINPGSTQQLATLLFDDWALPIQEVTATGDPSTNEASILGLLANPITTKEQKDALYELRGYKKSEKLLNTYIRKLAPGARTGKGKLIVGHDGWCHPDYNVTGTLSGRLSSANPNFQNIPPALRDIFIAPDGYVFLDFDYDQLELRFGAALAGASLYLDALDKDNIDIHNLSGEMIFGDRYWDVNGAPTDKRLKGKGEFKKRRARVKNLVYASIFWAEPPTIHGQLLRVTDRAGNLMFLDLTVREVRFIHSRWIAACPEFPVWWKSELKEYRAQGYTAEPVLGRRRYFMNGEDRNEIANFKPQAGGFSVVGLGLIDVCDNIIPFDYANRTGLANNCHDSGLWLVKESEAETLYPKVEQALTRKVEGLPVTFTVEGKIAKRWA